MPKQAQFYKVEYTIGTAETGYKVFTTYERGRANLMRLFSEVLTDKRLGSVMVEPVKTDRVPEHIRRDLEAFV